MSIKLQTHVDESLLLKHINLIVKLDKYVISSYNMLKK